MKDRYGFFFWLKWILWFAGSFIAAALFWTTVMQIAFGRIEGKELTITWSVAVFGSWFLLVIPFMRKKERIWKRLNDDQEKAVDAWLRGMGLFTGLLIASAFFWTWVLIGSGGHEGRPYDGLDLGWMKAVFATWLVILFPFLILMYRQADRIFKTAVVRQTYIPKFKSVYIEPSKRFLPQKMAEKIKTFTPTLSSGHVVTAVLKSGERVPHVFVLNANEILGVYDKMELGFEARDVVDVQKMDPGDLPPYEEAKWLRLDGRI